MTKVLILLLVLCAFATAMVPRERRAVDLEELPASSSTTTAAPNICAPTTPCGWSIYKPQIKIIDMFVVNGYCICEEGLNCAIDEDDKSVSTYVHRCRQPGSVTEISIKKR
ncbi:uncharacterized protein LOC135075762 [Ostrinia nubilalis]